MVDIRRKTYERNGIETIVDNDWILWLNEKHIEEKLDHKNLREFTAKKTFTSWKIEIWDSRRTNKNNATYFFNY